MSFPGGAAHVDDPSAEVAAEFIRGSDDAFRIVYERYARPIYDFFRWTVRDATAAEDLTQSTFLQAFERHASLRDPAALKGWLYRIAHNLAMNHVTRNRTDVELDADAPFASQERGPEEVAGSDEAAALVWDAAASLEPRQFAVLDLSLRKGLSTGEIADALEIDPAAASLAVHRAREALGNAVRFLAVARRRRHCERLAELVPAGIKRLTPEQRASVDRHMRRCPECQRTALLLTSPDELFSVAPLAALPALLETMPRRARGRAGKGARRLVRSPWGMGTAAVITAAVATTAVIATRPAAHTRAGSGGHTSAPTSQAASQPPFASAVAAGMRTATATGVPATASFRSVACPTSARCYAVAEDGGTALIATTNDSGTTWTAAPVRGATGLVAVACSAENACVAGGYSGHDPVILRTGDGGTSWTPAAVPHDAVVGAIACADASACLAVGERQAPQTPYVLASTDGGATWQARDPPSDRGYPGYLAAADCTDATHCWVVGSGIWLTTDLGTSWEDRSEPVTTCAPGQTICGGPTHTFTAVEFTSATEGWAVGGVPCGGYGITQCEWYATRTSDGGRTWHALPDGVLRAFPFGWGIACRGGACAAVDDTFSGGQVALSTDAGLDWAPVQHVNAALNALACSPDGRTCVAVGKAGSLLAASS